MTNAQHNYGDNICYVVFVRAAQIASFLAAVFVIVVNVWMIAQQAPSVNSVL